MITTASIKLALVDAALDPNPKRAARGVEPRFSIRVGSDVEANWEAVFADFYRRIGDTASKKSAENAPKAPKAPESDRDS